MTEEQLIAKLKELKQIKPREDWALLAKMNILGSDVPERKVVAKPAYRWSMANILGLGFQRKLAYAFLALFFVFAGAAGVVKYQTPSATKIAVKSEADVLAENTLKSNVEDFKLKSQNLAKAVKDNTQNPGVTIVAIKEVKDATINLTNELQKNPQLAKVIALDINNNKSLLDIPGGDELKATSNDLYKTIDQQMIKDLEGTTLTPGQKVELERIKASFDNGGDYATVLRDILFINASTNSTSTNSK